MVSSLPISLRAVPCLCPTLCAKSQSCPHLAYPGSCSFSEQEIEAAGKNPGAPTDPQRPCPGASGLCGFHLPGKLPSQVAAGRHGAERPSLVLDVQLAAPLPASLGLVWRSRSERVFTWPSCLPGTEDLCGLGQRLGVSLFSPLPSSPWHRAERSLRLINLPPSLLLRPMFYSWTSSLLCFTRMRASIFHRCFTRQQPAASLLLPTGSRTWKAGHTGLALGVTTDARAAFLGPSACPPRRR